MYIILKIKMYNEKKISLFSTPFYSQSSDPSLQTILAVSFGTDLHIFR